MAGMLGVGGYLWQQFFLWGGATLGVPDITGQVLFLQGIADCSITATYENW